MQHLQQLKAFDSSAGRDVEEMVALLVLANGMILIFEKLGETPEWLKDKRNELEAAIESSLRDENIRQLREVQAQREALKSREQKSQDLAEKEERLKKKLGLAQPG